tara:strand:- start:84 stop:599 length:516 start_codon:yes stop_codon:yes gene_type:complete
MEVNRRMGKKGKKKSNQSSSGDGNRRLAENRKARYEYDIVETLETGLELLGTEVKSIRAGKVNLKDGFCLIKKNQIQLHNVHISPHNHAGKFFNHDPLRIKKLLAHRKEIDKLKINLDRKGLALIPISLYLKGSWIKLKIGVGKGRKLHDKRHQEKVNQSKKDVSNALKRF